MASRQLTLCLFFSCNRRISHSERGSVFILRSTCGGLMRHDVYASVQRFAWSRRSHCFAQCQGGRGQLLCNTSCLPRDMLLARERECQQKYIAAHISRAINCSFSVSRTHHLSHICCYHDCIRTSSSYSLERVRRSHASPRLMR